MIDHLRWAVSAYLDQYPYEKGALGPLTAALDAGSDLTSRDTLPGHVTCSAIVVDATNRILHIRHRELALWLRPGGHIELGDPSPHQAALREVREETGIDGVGLLDLVPVDIDVHTIPASRLKNEPEHQHYDLRYLAAVGGRPAVRLQAEEVTHYDWLAPEVIDPAQLRIKLRQRLA